MKEASCPNCARLTSGECGNHISTPNNQQNVPQGRTVESYLNLVEELNSQERLIASTGIVPSFEGFVRFYYSGLIY